MREQTNALRNSNNNPRADTSGPTRKLCHHCTAVGHSVLNARDALFFNPKTIKNRPTWAKEITKVKGVAFEAGE